MSLGTKIGMTLGALLAVILMSAGFVGCGLYSTYNQAVVLENDLVAQMSSDKNTYDNYFKTVKEMAQVNEMYTDDLKKVYDGAIQGRYGKNGSRAVFQFIKEHNPTFDVSLYTQLQQTIKSSRLDFKTAQDTRIDKVRVYQNFLDVGLTGMAATAVLHFPRKFTRDELQNRYGTPIMSDDTAKAFATGKSEPIRVR